jgi:hypothetical protein
MWIVPANVAGSWRTPKGELTLTQTFQMISGTLGRQPVENGRLRGHEISFTVGGLTYTGRVDRDRMRVSTTVDDQVTHWTAVLQRPARTGADGRRISDRRGRAAGSRITPTRSRIQFLDLSSY